MDVRQVDKLWFQDVFRVKGLTQRKVGEYLDVHPSKITHVLGGFRRFEIEEVQLLSALLSVPADEITQRLGIQTFGPR